MLIKLSKRGRFSIGAGSASGDELLPGYKCLPETIRQKQPGSWQLLVGYERHPCGPWHERRKLQTARCKAPASRTCCRPLMRMTSPAFRRRSVVAWLRASDGRFPATSVMRLGWHWPCRVESVRGSWRYSTVMVLCLLRAGIGIPFQGDPIEPQRLCRRRGASFHLVITLRFRVHLAIAPSRRACHPTGGVVTRLTRALHDAVARPYPRALARRLVGAPLLRIDISPVARVAIWKAAADARFADHPALCPPLVRTGQLGITEQVHLVHGRPRRDVVAYRSGR